MHLMLVHLNSIDMEGYLWIVKNALYNFSHVFWQTRQKFLILFLFVFMTHFYVPREPLCVQHQWKFPDS